MFSAEPDFSMLNLFPMNSLNSLINPNKFHCRFLKIFYAIMSSVHKYFTFSISFFFLLITLTGTSSKMLNRGGNSGHASLVSNLREKIFYPLGFPGGSEVKVSACNVGDLGSIPGSGRSPGEGNGLRVMLTVVLLTLTVVFKLYYFYKCLLFQVLKLLMDVILSNNFLLLLRQ